MQVLVQKLSPVLVELGIEIAADRVHSEVDKELTTIAKSARVRGFRPGKAPRKVLSHLFGARVAASVAQRLVEETFQQAVSGQQLQPVSEPAFEPQRLEDNKPFTYKARFEVLPTIEHVDYDGLVARRPKIEASEEQISAELEQVRRAFSTLEAPAEPRPARANDVLVIDVEVEVGGEIVAEAGAKDFQAELGIGNLLPPIEQALLDQEVGATVVAHVDLSQNHPMERLRGQHAHFKLTIKDLKARVLPALDDELAKDAGEFDTLEQLRADVKAKIEKTLAEQADNAVAEQLVVELVKRNVIPVPQSLVEQQMRLTEREILARARSQGHAATGLGDELLGQVRADAEVKVRAGLLMAEIAKSNGIKVGDAEIEQGLQELAEQTGKNLARLRAEYRDPQQRQTLIAMILEDKVLDIIEAKAKIEEQVA